MPAVKRPFSDLGSEAPASSQGEARMEKALQAVPESIVRICKYCKCTSEDENPLVYARAQKPRLAWRRANGRECAVCPWVIDGDESLKSRKDTLEQDLEDPDKYSGYMGKRNDWITEKNRTGGAHIKHQQPAAATQVSADLKAGMETRERLGWLWPTKLWMAKIGDGKKPPRGKSTTIMHMGKPTSGVMMTYECKDGGQHRGLQCGRRRCAAVGGPRGQ